MTNADRSKSDAAVYIGLGSNIGDREANLGEATARIEKLGPAIVQESSIYETEPVGLADQPWFLNQVIETKIIDSLTSKRGPVLDDPEAIATVRAEALLSELLKIEHEMGRARTIANGPRAIDIDLLLFGDKIIGHSNEDGEFSFKDPTVPHPRMHLRRFVLEPLCEIAPELVHPVLKKTCREMLASLEDASTVRLFRKRL